MSVAGGMKSSFQARALSVAACFIGNIGTDLARLGRKPRAAYRSVISYERMRLPLRAVIALIFLIPLELSLDARASAAAVMWLLDAPAILAVRYLPEGLVSLFNELTDFGKSGWFLWPLGLMLLAIAAAATRPLDHGARLVLATVAVRIEFLFIAIAAPGLFATTIKRLIGRARPFVGGEADPSLYLPFAGRVEYSSLPSGHATTAFSVLVAFGVLWPKLRPLLWTYAIVIALSRVIVLAHHPTDVLAGALAGALGALLVCHAFAARRLVFAVDGVGAVRPMPGPSRARVKSVARAVIGP